MKIVTWNCNWAFRGKFKKALELDGDIYIVQECENPKLVKSKDFKDYEDYNTYMKFTKNHKWIGDNKNKGLGIFVNTLKTSEQQIKIEILPCNNNLDYFILCRVNEKFNLLGAWCHKGTIKGLEYIGQMWKYLEDNASELSETLIVGDFNSNAIWDFRHKGHSHSDVVDILSKIGLVSYYHSQEKENHGEEKKATFYRWKKHNKSYHIDYFFGKSEWVKSLEIGEFADWIKFSDHMPLIAEININ